MALGAYVRRRWRFVGFVLVLLAGTTLFALMTDRGHEPQWSVATPEAALTAVAPDGARTYVVTTDGNGTARDLVAYAADGAEAWRRGVPGNATTVLLEASHGTVALATEARTPTSGAHLLVLAAADGAVLLDDRLAHTARALALDGRDVAVAVQVPPEHPVRVWRDLEPAVDVTRNERVMSLDLAAGVLAVGTAPVAGDAAGRVLVVNATGAAVVDAPRDYPVLQVRLSDDGATLAAAGGTSSGRVERYDLDAPAPDVAVWEATTPGAATHLDLAADGARLLALVAPAGATSELRVYDADGGGATAWGVRASGIIRRDSTSTAAAVDLSPDARHVAYGTLTSGLTLYRVGDDEPRWRYDAAESETLSFARGAPDVLVAGLSIITGAGGDRLAYFHVDREPFVHDLSLFLPAAWVGLVLAAVVVLGVGYVRRPGV